MKTEKQVERRLKMVEVAWKRRLRLNPSATGDPIYQQLLGAMWTLEWLLGWRDWPQKLTRPAKAAIERRKKQ